MCGRVTVHTPAGELARALGLELGEGLSRPRYNLSPTQLLPVVADAAPTTLVLFKLGLVSSWSKGPERQ